MKLRFWCKNNRSVPYGYANGLSCVGCHAGTLSNTPVKDDHHVELNDRFVDYTE